MYFVSINENKRMKPVESVLRREEGERENDGGVTVTKIYYKHLCKCHNVQLLHANEITKNKDANNSNVCVFIFV
jgi:hypothetical protein